MASETSDSGTRYGSFKQYSVEDLRKRLIQDQETIEKLPKYSAYRSFRERLLKKCHSLLKAQEEKNIDNEEELLHLMRAMQLVKPRVTEDMRHIGVSPCPEHDIMNKGPKEHIGEHLRRRYFGDQEFAGYSSTFPPRTKKPMPDYVKDMHFFNYTERHDLTWERIFEAGMTNGAFENVTVFDTYKANDEYYKRVMDHKLAWAREGGHGDYPVDRLALSPSYYEELARQRNRSKTGIPAVDPPLPPGVIKRGVDDVGQEDSDDENLPVLIDADEERQRRHAASRDDFNPFPTRFDIEKDMSRAAEAREAHEKKLAEAAGLEHLISNQKKEGKVDKDAVRDAQYPRQLPAI
uniref:Uncharacterized protein n=1 Tax=Lotharella oceanica TaxID=641309 RepID=A0A7S2XEV6_9EUKA